MTVERSYSLVFRGGRYAISAGVGERSIGAPFEKTERTNERSFHAVRVKRKLLPSRRVVIETSE